MKMVLFYRFNNIKNLMSLRKIIVRKTSFEEENVDSQYLNVFLLMLAGSTDSQQLNLYTATLELRHNH